MRNRYVTLLRLLVVIITCIRLMWLVLYKRENILNQHDTTLTCEVIHQSIWSLRVSPVGKPRGFWYMKISVPTLMCLFVSESPVFPLHQRYGISLFYWVWTLLSYSPGWDVRKLSESLGLPAWRGDWGFTLVHNMKFQNCPYKMKITQRNGISPKSLLF